MLLFERQRWIKRETERGDRSSAGLLPTSPQGHGWAQAEAGDSETNHCGPDPWFPRSALQETHVRSQRQISNMGTAL